MSVAFLERKAAYTVAALALAGFLAVELIVLGPLRTEVRDLRQQAREKGTRLRGTGWPLVLAQLEPAAGERQRQTTVAARTRDEVLTAATSLFRERVQSQYETREHFRRQVTRLDYQEEFNRVERKLRDAGVPIDKEIFKMSEDSVGADTYQLVLQVWTVEAVVDRALAAGLKVTPAREVAEGGRGGAMLSVLDPAFFLLDGKDTEPYLMRVPVRIRVAGSLESLQRLLATAGDRTAFLSVDRMELRKPSPGGREPSGHPVEADLVCSSFFLLRDDWTPAPPAGPPKVLPHGT